ncbi:MAG: iron-containing alcohol dehydrogenase [Oscillospiraceae bacterium]|nr:iron-containing alcohol dehydrogenase [Oscillospiraceae bacterium]
MYSIYCRVFQAAFKLVANFLPWRQPQIFTTTAAMVDMLRERHAKRGLVVTDKVIASLGLADTLLSQLTDAGIAYTVYDKTSPNPTIANIEEALAQYKAEQCEFIVAVGGGSPIDCAKGVAVRVARPKKSIPQLRGQIKVRRKLPLLIAIPTTAGTGSETTVAAVITDSETHEKYAINDPVLIPRYAVHDPTLTAGLPPLTTATTGIDALVHAVEAYIGGSNTRETRRNAEEAVRLIFANLVQATENGSDLTARANMQRAAFLAGAAFTRAYVGNIHAVAHTLGGMYGTPHGLANAVILPYVLRRYGHKIDRRLAELARAAGIKTDGTEVQRADAFRAAVLELNRRLNIPTAITALRREDIPLLAGRALKEANPLYPVPVIFNRADMENIYRAILAE